MKPHTSRVPRKHVGSGTAVRKPATRCRLATAASLLVLALAACWSDDEIGTPLSVELIGPETGLVGDELSVLYNVSGRRIEGIVFTWGDGATDSLPTVGAQTAAGSMRHTYESSGMFIVRARVVDALEGVASAQVSINVQSR